MFVSSPRAYTFRGALGAPAASTQSWGQHGRTLCQPRRPPYALKWLLFLARRRRVRFILQPPTRSASKEEGGGPRDRPKAAEGNVERLYRGAPQGPAGWRCEPLAPLNGRDAGGDQIARCRATVVSASEFFFWETSQVAREALPRRGFSRKWISTCSAWRGVSFLPIRSSGMSGKRSGSTANPSVSRSCLRAPGISASQPLRTFWWSERPPAGKYDAQGYRFRGQTVRCPKHGNRRGNPPSAALTARTLISFKVGIVSGDWRLSRLITRTL
jgi:hypothetical protein